MWARIHLLPVLQAEEDRDQVRRYLADQAREKELLGENMSVYNTDRYVDDLGLYPLCLLFFASFFVLFFLKKEIGPADLLTLV